MAASQEFYDAHRKQKEEKSIFTYFLLEGLRGANGASTNKEGFVTPESLGRYVLDKIIVVGLRQKPIMRTESSDKIVLANYSATDLIEKMREVHKLHLKS